jgi:GNAT superfamily N-acetyltransferase
MPPCEGALHLRRATEADAAAMARIQVRASRAAYRGLLPDELLAAMTEDERERAWRREIAMLPEELRPSVAEVAGGIVGFVGALPSEDPDARRDSELTVSVDPDCWAHGVGRKLVEHQVRLLRHLGREEATTWVMVEDRPARHFSEALGWRPDGTRRTRRIGHWSTDEVRYRLEIR